MRLTKIPALMILLTVILGGCERIMPVRTLPSWVQGIHIPMVHNGTYEPEIEELLTRLTQEIFLADGRIDIVEERHSDLVLAINVVIWDRKTAGASGDDVASDMAYQVTADLKLVEPNNRKIIYAELGQVTTLGRFNTDTRSIRFVPDPDRKHRLCENLAVMILNRTITGVPRKLEGNLVEPSRLQLRTGEQKTGGEDAFDPDI